MIWIKRSGKKEGWHGVLDMWDTATFCGLSVGLKFECMRDRPSGERCGTCELEGEERDRANNEPSDTAAG